MAICKEVLKPINTRLANTNMGEDGEEPLSPGARLLHAPETNCSILAIFGFKTRINVEAFKHGFEHTVIKHPRFSSKLVFDAKEPANPVAWARTEVNVDDLIIDPYLDPHMDSPDRFVEDYVSNISKTTMDLSKPLWEFHVLNVKTSEATSIGVFRFHHSLGDGVSLISILLACARKSSDPDSLPSLPSIANKEKPRRRGYNRLLSYFFAFLSIFKVLWNTLVDMILFMATMICLKDTKSPLRGTDPRVDRQKRFVYRILSLDDVKLVKNAMGMTINDVILGITQAGLSRYLNEKYGKDKGANKTRENNMPKHIRLRSTVFMNLRPSQTIEGLAEMMKDNSKGGWEWGNLTGAVIIPFHIALRDDPLDYIRIAKTTIDKKKQSFEVWLTYFATKLLVNTLGLKVAATIFYKALSNTTLTFSNMAGPTEEMTLWGHPVVFLAPSVYGFPQGLTVHFQSYMDKMTVVLAVDENIIPDPHKLCDEIEESLILIKNSVNNVKKLV